MGQLFLVELERHLGHVRNELADCPAIGSDSQLLVGQHLFQFHSIDDGKDPLQQRLGNFKSDEVMVLVGRVAILGHLQRVESEFGFEMRGFVLRVLHDGPYFARSLG